MQQPPYKCYLRREELAPDTQPQNAIRRGLWAMGCWTEDLYSDDDVEDLTDLGPDVGVAGYVSTVQRALRRLGRPLPPVYDYPEVLQPYFGRHIAATTLGVVRQHGQPVFIKPERDHKLFTGFVWSDDEGPRRKIVTLPDDVPVWASTLVDFVSEYRAFVLRDEIVDCRRYNGDWAISPDRRVIERAVQDMAGWAPVAYCVDFGVCRDGRTLLVEMNDGFAFGPYGLDPLLYATMITARWRELVTPGIDEVQP